MQITYQERVGPDSAPLAVPVIPLDATADEIETIVAAAGTAVMTDEQAAEQIWIQMRPGWRNPKHRKDWFSSLERFTFPDAH